MLSLSLPMLSALILAATSSTPEVEWQKASWGRSALIPFQSAPFPHVNREGGYRSLTLFYPAFPHYSDSRVPVHVPYNVSPLAPVDFVVYLHGHTTNMEKLWIVEQWPQKIVEQAGVAAVFLFPIGPKMVPDSDYGKLCEPGGLIRLLDEALAVLKREAVVEKASLGRVVLAAHGGGYQAIARIMSDPEQRARVSEVNLLDAAYGDFDGLVDAASAEHVLFRSVVTPSLASNNLEILGRLEALERPYAVVRETDLEDRRLTTHRHPLFIHSQLAHHELADHYLARLVRTGVLGR